MITQIRGYLKSGTYKVVLWIIVFMLGFGSLPGLIRLSSSSGGPWVFRINQQEISHAEFVREVDRQRNYIAQVRAQYGEYADMFLKNIDVTQLAISNLQLEELLHQVANTIGLVVDNEYVAEKLHDPRFLFGDLAGLVPHNVLTDTGIDQRILYKHLARKGLSIRDFERKAARLIEQNLVGDLISVAAYVPRFELQALYIARNIDKKFSYLTLSSADYVQAEKERGVSKADVASFYAEHQAEYAVPEKRTGMVWVCNADKFGIQITDEKIEAYYDRHKTDPEYQDKPSQVQVRTILFALDGKESDEVKAHAMSVRQQLLEDPSQFAEQARTLSADAETRQKGGLLPFFVKGEKDPLFERTAFLLKAPGDISELIETDKGFEIIQLVEKQLRTVKPLSAVKEVIKKKLVATQFKSEFESDMRQLLSHKDSQQNLEAVKQFVARKKAAHHTLDKVVAGDTHELKTLFDIKKIDGISFYQENGQGVIVQLVAIDKQHTPALVDIENKVVADIYKYRADQALEKDLQEAQKLASTEPFAEVAKKFGTVAHASDWIGMQDGSQIKSFFPKNTPQDFLLQMERVGSMAVRMMQDGGILVKVDAMKEYDAADFENKYSSLNKEVARKRERLVVEGFVASLYRNATIETNENMSRL